ncbi:MAG TPA: penicillin-binding protein 2 [Tepidiformaceae bacterium]|nr:penicillin-binding protein 2 [Tepidiformaceae bacterium]
MNELRGLPGRLRNRPRGNLNVLSIAVFGLFALLTARLAYMQIVKGPSYSERSRDNHLVRTDVVPPRGLIYDRNGVQLVQNVPSYSAQVVPDLLPPESATPGSNDPRYQIYQQLEKITGTPALAIQQQVKQQEDSGKGGQAITVANHLTQDQAQMLDEVTNTMPGVTLVITPARNYTGGSDFSNILGYIGAQSSENASQYAKLGYSLFEPVGVAGLEQVYQQELRGTPGYTLDEQDAQGTLIQQVEDVAPKPGDSLKLAIDKGLQDYVAQILQQYMSYGSDNAFASETARTAAAVVMNPNNGEIYAMVSIPGYDDNIFNDPVKNAPQITAMLQDRVHSPLTDHAIAAAAPGSTFKMITAAAGLQNGTVTPQTSRYIPSTKLDIKGDDGKTYTLIDWETHGTIDLYQAIAQSSDIYFYGVACGLPATEGIPGMKGLASDSDKAALILGQYARAFGLGSPTGVDLDNEASGNVPSPAQKLKTHDGEPWVYFDTCYMGIGQGDVAASPLQMARVTAAVANGGKLVTPHVVNQVVAPDGKVVRNITGDTTQVPVSKANLDVVKEGMHECVNGGACESAAAPGVDMSGKTGTAEFNDEYQGGILTQHAWFTGFAPFENPQVVITVYFDLGWGGARAAPAASKIAEYFFQNVKVNQ